MNIDLSGAPVDAVWLGPVQLFPPSGGGGLGKWADVTVVNNGGFATQKHEYTDADGIDWTAWEFGLDGDFTTTEGLIDALIVGGGGSPAAGNVIVGAAATPMRAIRKLSAGKHTVTVGMSGFPSGDDAMRHGNNSTIGAFIGYGGRYGFVENLNISDDITGSIRTYGLSGVVGLPPQWPQGFGGGVQGGNGRPGGSGVVIIRVPRANAKA